VIDERLVQTIENLESWIYGKAYSGFDPYDGLNSKILDVLPLPGKYLKIAWIQFFKRCPVNLRKLFLIPEGINPKGMGLLLSSYVQLYRATKRQEYIERAGDVARWLANNCSDGYSGACWGYNFNWQSRAFYVPKGTPTIVNTSFVGHALLDYFEEVQEERWLTLARSACHFLVSDLNQSRDENGLCFSYTPIDSLKIHNANLLGSGLLARTSLVAKTDCWDEVKQSVAYSLHHQHEDGSWYYAEPEYQQWVDSFHTGFNLMSLRYANTALNDHLIEEAITRGEGYYRARFFGSDGTPAYYHDSVYPIDIHSSAMGLRYFSNLQDSSSQLTCSFIWDWLYKNMRNGDGTFMYQRNKYWVNRIPYMRWSQGWALYGLSHFLNSVTNKEIEDFETVSHI